MWPTRPKDTTLPISFLGSSSERVAQNRAQTLAHRAAAPRGGVTLQQGTAELRTSPLNAEPSQVLWKDTGMPQVGNSREGSGPK